MRISLGTAGLLGLEDVKTDAVPGLAYLMHGNKCRNNCKFCTQSAGKSSSKLSRIVWPEYPREETERRLLEAKNKGLLKRCCIQVIDDGDKEGLMETISMLKKTGLKISLSMNINNFQVAEELFEAGVERIAMPIDVINSDKYREIKGGDFHERLSFLFKISSAFPCRITTHIIIGLGETEEETVKLMDDLARNIIGVSLFAFTPVKGSPLEKHSQPDEGTYRRIQVARHLICEKGYDFNDFSYSAGKINGITRDRLAVLEELIKAGTAFKTSGCSDCNRPYYNERPGGIIYNYPRDLKNDEVVEALKVSSLWGDDEINLILETMDCK